MPPPTVDICFFCRSAEKEIFLLHFLKDIYKVILLKAFSPKQNFLVATIYFFHNSFLFAAGHLLQQLLWVLLPLCLISPYFCNCATVKRNRKNSTITWLKRDDVLYELIAHFTVPRIRCLFDVVFLFVQVCHPWGTSISIFEASPVFTGYTFVLQSLE